MENQLRKSQDGKQVKWKWKEIFFNKWQASIMNENAYGTMKVSKHRGMEVWKYCC
jgi:hypothetical protein